MLSEQKILHSVTHNKEANALEVKWLNQILRDGEVISSVPHRNSYTVETKDAFLSDVENGAEYLRVAGWQ